jgi:4-amino-4-deoxy-L-arabinose transferase-like glycosyltransferase
MADRLATPRTGYAPVITPARVRPTVAPDMEPAYPARGPRWRNPLWIGLAVAATVTLVVHVAANVLTPYGLHRDELLYLAMGRHLRLWAMDFPPGIALAAELTRALLGDALWALRLPSTLAATLLVSLAYGLARLLGGRGRACALAALAVLASPLFLRTGTLFQPVVLDELWWTLGFVALVRIGTHVPAPHDRTGPFLPAPVPAPANAPDRKAWLGLGAAVGLGLLTKFSIVFFGAAVVVALFATPLRHRLATPWPWVALVVALAIGSPSLVGQARLGWPVVEQMAELRATQLEHVGPIDFLVGQLLLGPSFALAAFGAWYLLRDRSTTRWRAVGWTCCVAAGLLLVTRGKPYYVASIYPVLFAAGAVAFERRVLRLPTLRTRRRARLAAYAVVALYGLATLPFGLPVLPPATMARYAAALGGAGTTTNTGGRLALPQDYADMLGWPEIAARVDVILDSLPRATRAEAVLIAGNYGEAGALEFYGPALQLPPVVSTAGSYWFFGPGNLPGTTAVAVGIPLPQLRHFFRRVTPLGRIRHEWTTWVVDEERDVVVALCEDPVLTLQDVWPSLRPR